MAEQMMPFHDHPLLFTRFESYPCDLCHAKGGIFFYCDKCHYSRHKNCYESALVVYTHLPDEPYHDHPYSVKEFETYVCCFCHKSSGYGYHCKECSFAAHKKCINSFNNSSLCKHSLKICARGSLKYPDGQCHFCMETLADAFFFHCSICNISVDEKCMNPTRQLLNQKNHEHALTLLLRLVTFTCNGCGLLGDRNPYICLECDFMMHKDCVDLPRVININRHDHRVSRTSHLGYGDWNCGVCRQKIDWVYGAFACPRCPFYAVHSKCATRDDVWDGNELEDEPDEEDVEPPFEVINEKEIIHFTHQEHHLKIHDEYHVTDHDIIRCTCCVISINEAPFYKCVECEFYLHKACANLPRVKRHFLHNHRIFVPVLDGDKGTFQCAACDQISNGFRYTCLEGCYTLFLDTRCASILEPFQHELHSHPLYRTSTREATCGGCGTYSSYVLNCTECEYTLCMKCATLPRKIKNRCDDHFLSLFHGAGNASGDLWCDLCETKTDPSVWYYGCDKCGTTLHVHCVLGDMYYMKTGPINDSPVQLQVVPNNGVSRPLCASCQGHCRFPFFVKIDDKFTSYFCSLNCPELRNL